MRRVRGASGSAGLAAAAGLWRKRSASQRGLLLASAGTVLIFTLLLDIGLELHAGELLVVKGRSGSGTTTLLNLLGALDRPTSGSVLLGDLDLSTASEAQLVEVRRSEFGFVFQSFGLIPVLSAAENIE